jgi:tRNA(Ile)-lysidine synthase
MQVDLPKSGVYVAAISGGVDSMALLHMLQARRLQAQSDPLIIIVAHLDHGIRDDSVQDRMLVQEIAGIYGMPFVFDEAVLGNSASEATARQARYAFLNKVVKNSAAQAIITAHHEDDALETAILNIARGSGRKGMTSLSSRDELLRPLIEVSKKDLINYAQTNGLKWREDSTNNDTKYKRNHIRHNVVGKFDKDTKDELKQLIHKTRLANEEIDEILNTMLGEHLTDNILDRNWLVSLPHNLGREVLATWLRQNNYREFDKKTLERLIVGAKVAKNGAKIEIIKNAKMLVKKDELCLVK